MDGSAGQTRTGKFRSDSVSPMLGTTEYQHLLPFLLFYQTGQGRDFFRFIDGDQLLLNLLNRGIRWRDRQFNRITGNRLSQRHHIVGKGGREQQRLTLRRQ